MGLKKKWDKSVSTWEVCPSSVNSRNPPMRSIPRILSVDLPTPGSNTRRWCPSARRGRKVRTFSSFSRCLQKVQHQWELCYENLWIPGWGHCLWELTEVWLVSCSFFFSVRPPRLLKLPSQISPLGQTHWTHCRCGPRGAHLSTFREVSLNSADQLSSGD